MNWQSIETAPKDGTEIIAMYVHIDTQIVHNAFYMTTSDFEYMTASDFEENVSEYIGWWSYDKSEVSRVMLDDWMTPTHWMPLPDAPENNQPEGT